MMQSVTLMDAVDGCSRGHLLCLPTSLSLRAAGVEPLQPTSVLICFGSGCPSVALCVVTMCFGVCTTCSQGFSRTLAEAACGSKTRACLISLFSVLPLAPFVIYVL